jgi:hypothetical protein
MSKKNKQQTVPSIPEIYRNVTRDPSRQHNCICEDVHNQFFRHNKREEINVLKDAQFKVWPNFDAFTAENEQTILAYHDSLFKANPPKDQDKITTALYVWFALCDKATDRTSKTPVTTEGRKSTNLGRKYTWTGKKLEETSIKTPQAMTCFRIFRDTLDAKEKTDTEKMPAEVKAAYVPAVTEEELKTAIINRAGEIRTRQDPWRIFQYYRPELIKAGLLRHD